VKVSYVSSRIWLQLLLQLGSGSMSVQDLLPRVYGGNKIIISNVGFQINFLKIIQTTQRVSEN
jgi:hypothetical protein